MKDKDRILRGIAEYKPMQEEIIQAIKDHGGKLTEDEFDNEFSSCRTFKDKNGVTRAEIRPLSATIFGCPIDSTTFILGGINGDCIQQQYLHLAQLMIAADLLDAKTEDGIVVYREVKK